MKNIKTLKTGVILGLSLAISSFTTPQAFAQTRTEISETDWSETVNAPRVEKNISYGELIVGNPDAKVEIIEYFSFTCGACASFHNIFLPPLTEKYIKTGKAKLILRNQIRDAADLTAAKAAHCSTPGNAYKLTGELLYLQKDWVRGQGYRELIVNLVEKAGINREKIEACIDNKDLEKSVLTMMEEGIRRGISGTPSLIINGKPLDHLHTYQELEESIEAALTTSQ